MSYMNDLMKVARELNALAPMGTQALLPEDKDGASWLECVFPRIVEAGESPGDPDDT